MPANRIGAKLTGACALALLLASAASAAGPVQHRRFARSQPTQFASSIGSFTPAAADPRLASSLVRGGLPGATGFRFTPSATPGASRRVTVAVRARAATPAQAERTQVAGFTAIGPQAYNLGVSLGWKRFALTSDYARVDLGPVPGSRETADVALSFAGHRWSTRLALAADRALGEVPHLLDHDRNVSVDLGGSYSISNRLDVTGGLRYKRDFDQLQMIADDRRDSQAVYIGTAFRF